MTTLSIAILLVGDVDIPDQFEVLFEGTGLAVAGDEYMEGSAYTITGDRSEVLKYLDSIPFEDFFVTDDGTIDGDWVTYIRSNIK